MQESDSDCSEIPCSEDVGRGAVTVSGVWAVCELCVNCVCVCVCSVYVVVKCWCVECIGAALIVLMIMPLYCAVAVLTGIYC